MLVLEWWSNGWRADGTNYTVQSKRCSATWRDHPMNPSRANMNPYCGGPPRRAEHCWEMRDATAWKSTTERWERRSTFVSPPFHPSSLAPGGCLWLFLCWRPTMPSARSATAETNLGLRFYPWGVCSSPFACFVNLFVCSLANYVRWWPQRFFSLLLRWLNSAPPGTYPSSKQKKKINSLL